MRLAIVMAGAALLGPVLGILASGSINTAPKQSGGDMLALLDSIPRHEEASFDVAQSATLPDHYPLVTPRGTVQVADLWLHGLYRDRPPLYPDYEFDHYGLEQEPHEFDVPAGAQHPVADVGVAQDLAHSGQEREPPGYTAELPMIPRPASDAAITSVTQPQQALPPNSGPKIVDVAAVLSAR